MTNRKIRKKFHYLYKSDLEFKQAIDKGLIDRPNMNFRQIIDESLRLNPNLNDYFKDEEVNEK